MRSLFALLAFVVLASASQLPTFPTDWSAKESSWMVVWQGDYKVVNDMYCCPIGNCEIQTQALSGTHYFDYSHNRTRFDYDDPTEIIVTMYDIGKEMEVDANLNCVEWCPTEFDLEPYSLDPTAKDNGAVTIQGKTYENYTWAETIFDIIVMEFIEVLVDQKQNPAIPYYEKDEITPFGQDMGYEETMYTNFKAGTQDPSKFAVTGIDQCEMASDCDQNLRQHVRLRDKALKTFLNSEQNKQRKAAHSKPHSKPASKFL